MSNLNQVVKCPHCEKRWVNPNNPSVSKSYEKGDFPRPFCRHNEDWCEFKFSYRDCPIFVKWEKE